MFTHIHSATIAVNDQEAALDFYTNVLGFEVAMDAPMGPEMRWLTVVPPGATTQLVLGAPGWAPQDTPGGETGITLVTDDIDKTYEELSAKGVQFRGPVEDMPWGGRATWFSDPDGNVFFLSDGR